VRQVLLWRVAVIGLEFLACFATSARATDCVVLDLPVRLRYSKAIFVGKVIEGDVSSSGRRFRISEAFKGVKGDYVDVEEFPGGPYFRLGEEYLVFAGLCPISWKTAGRKCLAVVGPCSGTVQLEYALADVEQLRIEKNGQRMASVYGMVWERAERGDGSAKPLPNVVVRLRSAKKTFEAKTDRQGVYAFRRLPAGKYQVSADLPPGLVMAGTSHYPRGPIEVTRHTCYQLDIYAENSSRQR